MNNDKNQFGNYIALLCKQQGLTFQQLCNGLCHSSMITRICSGKYMPEKLLRDRLLARLGVSSEHYESFFEGKDYAEWKKRQQLLQKIVRQEWEEAERALARYHQGCSRKKKLDYQFYLAMRALLEQQKGASDAELAEIFCEAAKLTVPKLGIDNPKKQPLAIQELNLLLEHERYSDNVDSRKSKTYKAMLEYIRDSAMIPRNRNKIYPKVVFYFCEHQKKQKLSLETCAQMLVLCNEAIEMQKCTQSFFYLWELCLIREEMIGKMIESLEEKGEDRKAFSLFAMQKEAREHRMALDAVYKEYHLPKRMQGYCYLYEEKRIYSIGDIVRIRREMLKMTQEELASGICSQKTLGRLERNQAKTQNCIVKKLFKRLNLPDELKSCEAQSLFDRRKEGTLEGEKADESISKMG